MRLSRPLIPAIAAVVIGATGWRRRLIAFAAGATGALAMAPYNFLPALVVPLTIAVWLIDGSAAGLRAPPRGPSRLGLPAGALKAFGAGWWWGFGYLVAGLWWLGNAFLVDADEFLWALPLGVLGLPAALAFYPAVGFLLSRLLWSGGPGRLFALAAGLTSSEWLRGHALTGFPWNVLGQALGDNIVTAQLASLTGLYGLTIAAILIFSAPATLADKTAVRESGSIPRPVLLAGVGLAAIFAFGALRLAGAPPEAHAGLRLRIMQPNLAIDEKFRPENKAQIMAHYLALSESGSADGDGGLNDFKLLIWPESSFPFILSRAPWARSAIAAMLPQGTVLLTGAARDDESSRGSSRPRYFNSILAVTANGEIEASYDKVHLVPFGEYLPFRDLLERLGLRQFVHTPGGFEPGSGRPLLTVPGVPEAAPLICYEAIFPGEAVPPGAQPRPRWLLNVTTDSWFGTAAGPYQHFAQARLRAIEEGLPLIRAATTGISAIIDPYGRVLAALPLGAEGVLDGFLPQDLDAPLFARFPFASAAVPWAVVFALALAARLRD